MSGSPPPRSRRPRSRPRRWCGRRRGAAPPAGSRSRRSRRPGSASPSRRRATGRRRTLQLAGRGRLREAVRQRLLPIGQHADRERVAAQDGAVRLRLAVDAGQQQRRVDADAGDGVGGHPRQQRTVAATTVTPVAKRPIIWRSQRCWSASIGATAAPAARSMRVRRSVTGSARASPARRWRPPIARAWLLAAVQVDQRHRVPRRPVLARDMDRQVAAVQQRHHRGAAVLAARQRTVKGAGELRRASRTPGRCAWRSGLRAA